ncbi:hypothetical protein Q5Y75_23515 [Ruegeria sp. 2205SS24-7]|uniref:hypothetical protein n=1 Tax=Ruegeria discodermiae TaxID=3064389 RepID=UPI0027411BC9|nr:hypothetical protein [Ruegeria sp. 2205SS24-7]MDP5220167.1 hypothetical protein [Ruegeria sp. 2205SS24-7]
MRDFVDALRAFASEHGMLIENKIDPDDGIRTIVVYTKDGRDITQVATVIIEQGSEDDPTIKEQILNSVEEQVKDDVKKGVKATVSAAGKLLVEWIKAFFENFPNPFT